MIEWTIKRAPNCPNLDLRSISLECEEKFVVYIFLQNFKVFVLLEHNNSFKYIYEIEIILLYLLTFIEHYLLVFFFLLTGILINLSTEKLIQDTIQQAFLIFLEQNFLHIIHRYHHYITSYFF